MADIGPTSPLPEIALSAPEDADHVRYNPSRELLREFSRELETTTEFGSPAYVSEFRSRQADRTKNAVDDEFDDRDVALVESAFEFARDNEMICIDRQIGRHPDQTYVGRYYVPVAYGRIALAVSNLFEPATTSNPDFTTIQVPEYAETAIRVDPDAGLTTVLGSDYTGEAKKSFLRLFMYRVKQDGGLGLHAGSKRVTIDRTDGERRDVGQLFLGLSATGKSTLTAHGLWLDGDQEARMLQDDVCALLPNGTVAGSEGNGLYVKTIGLEREEQPAMYAAVTHESAVLENVDVDDDGRVDFNSDEYTTNGRASIRREHLPSADEDIDLERVDQVFFITRNPVMPPVAKLAPEAAAAAFMLGESIETSAGDPSRAGESVRVVGTNPFIVGSKGEEGNRFRNLVEALDVDCFVLNTGCLGASSKDIGVEDTVRLLCEIARGSVVWHEDDATGLTIPRSVPGMDIDAFAVSDHVNEYERKLRELRSDRRDYLSEFEALDDQIADAVY
ncbi:MAG: phosphoenolpyruvate carboxykinase (ATP) [Natronomonas sp.]